MIECAWRHVAVRGIPLLGNDIDTDLIIPARFLKTVTNEGLGLHAFEDARKHDPEHPFNQKAYEGASVLVGGMNFGCGSSREHAPESLKQWGIKAIVGGSFAEIFFGNCTMLGIPCLSISQDDVLWLQRAVGRDPKLTVTVDVERQEVRTGHRVIPARIADGAPNHLVSGAGTAPGALPDAGDAIAAPA